MVVAIFSANESNNQRRTTLSFFANNLYGDLGIAEIRAVLFDYAQIDAMLLKRGYFRSDSFRVNFLADVFLIEYFFERKERAKFQDEKLFGAAIWSVLLFSGGAEGQVR